MKWSESQIEELRFPAANGATNAGMAAHFGVPVVEIHAKRSRLGITIAKVGAAQGNVSGTEPASTHEKDFSLTCVAMHLACFTFFATKKIPADFTLPCEICENSKNCKNGDEWLNNFSLFYQKSGLHLSDRTISDAVIRKAKTGFAQPCDEPLLRFGLSHEALCETMSEHYAAQKATDIAEITRQVILELKRTLLAEFKNDTLPAPAGSSMLDFFCKAAQIHNTQVLKNYYQIQQELIDKNVLQFKDGKYVFVTENLGDIDLDVVNSRNRIIRHIRSTCV